MKAINKQDLINYLKKSPENLNFNIFGTMLDDFRNTYETDEQIVNKIRGIITNIIESSGSISPEDDTITELVDLITELLPEKMIIKPVGTLQITENGEYDVMNKAGVNVAVADALADYIRNNITTFEIPEGITAIPANTFKNYTNLETVVIPDSVTSIGENAFYDCANLTTVDGGCFVNSMGNNAFYGCPSSIETGTVGQLKYSKYNNKITVSGSGDLRDNTFIGLRPITDVIIHEGVTNIDKNAFYGWTELTSITIPDSVTSIGDYAFYDCTGLTSVTIENGVTSIGNSAFRGCTGLTSVTIPNSVTEIGGYAFYGCTGLTSVTIGNSVTSIGEYAFRDCTGLTRVNISDMAAWCNISFNIESNPLWYAHNLYLNNELVTDLVISDSVTSIGSDVFGHCTGLTSVTIPDSVTRIGNNAFYGCTGLTDVYYTGTQEQWNNIQIGYANNALTNAIIHYNYTPSN